ncbi:MAG: hypothetical protein KC561_21775, partial [Myxococcales bacterium]|nr:hypothetical protein [Myxococcales bacterium]
RGQRVPSRISALARQGTTDRSFGLTVEGGRPNRFMELIYYPLYLDRTPGRCADIEVTSDDPSTGSQERHTSHLDLWGLGDFPSTPTDVTIWTVRCLGEPDLSERFEVVPGFDGLQLEVDPPLVTQDAPIRFTLSSTLTNDQLFVDVYRGNQWLTGQVVEAGRGSGAIPPPASGWGDGAPAVLSVQLSPSASRPAD